MILEEGRALARDTLVEDENFFELKRKEKAVEQVVVAEGEKIFVKEDISVDENLPQKHRESLLVLVRKYLEVVATSMKELGRKGWPTSTSRSWRAVTQSDASRIDSR